MVSASVSPSEDPEKVALAVANVLGRTPGETDKGPREIRLVSDELPSLSKLRDQMRDRRVRGVARRLLEDGRSGDRTSIMLNRQAAFVGVLALCSAREESPLGPIDVRIESKKLDDVIEWLAGYETG